MTKTSIEIHAIWHTDKFMQPMPVTIITTFDKQGRLNAAPYSLVVPFCESPKQPQVLVNICKYWHTAANIEQTGEFVINYPLAQQFRDIVETGRFYDEGVNELEFTGYTTLPSKTVRVPRIAECYQHVECRVHEIIRPSDRQINVIADILDISLDETLCQLPRSERVKKLRIPVYMGIDENRHHLFGEVQNTHAVEVNSLVK
jgi:flavin reductase (DIM6/NTAB) family NADH-FMN oxidoreductase RutF